MNSAQLIVDSAGAGDWNMAVDEALLEAAAERGEPVLRFYQWERATVSLGYFQQAADRQTHAASRGAPLVRRLSGGGAIVHDRELTYSLTVPSGHRLGADTQQLYNRVHLALIAALARWNVGARLNDVVRPDEPFLCFERRASGDVLVGEAKITGSAQRRRHGCVLQHGSVLLRTSPAAPELPGLDDLAQVRIEAGELASAWAGELAGTLGLTFAPRSVPVELNNRVKELAEVKYRHAGWTCRR